MQKLSSPYTFEVEQGQNSLTKAQLEIQYKHLFRKEHYLEPVIEYLEPMLSNIAHNSIFGAKFNKAKHKLISTLQSQKFIFSLEQDVETIKPGKHQCFVRIGIANLDEIMEIIAADLAQIEQLLKIEKAYIASTEKHSQLSAKIRNLVEQIRKVDDALVDTERQSFSPKHTRQKARIVEKLIERLQITQNQIINLTENRAEVNQILAQVRSWAINPDSEDTDLPANLVNNFQAPINLASTIREKFALSINPLIYNTHDSSLENQSEEIAISPEITDEPEATPPEKRVKRQNSRWRIASIAAITMLGLTAIYKYDLDQKKASANATQSSEASNADADWQQRRFKIIQEIQKNTGINPEKISEMIDNTESKPDLVYKIGNSIPPIIIKPHYAENIDIQHSLIITNSFQKIVDLIYGEKVKIKPFILLAEGNRRLNTIPPELCDLNENFTINYSVLPPSHKPYNFKIDELKATEMCQQMEKSTRQKFNMRITKDQTGKSHYTQIVDQKKHPQYLDNAKQSLLDYIDKIRDTEKMPSLQDPHKIRQAKDLQEMESAYVEFLGRAAIVERRHSEVQTGFYISPQLKKGISMIYPEVHFLIVNDADKHKLHSIEDMKTGVGGFEQNICGGNWNFGISIQPNDQKISRIYYPYDLEPWRSEHCK